MKMLLSRDCDCFCCSGRAWDLWSAGPPWVAWAGLTWTKGEAHISIVIRIFQI